MPRPRWLVPFSVVASVLALTTSVAAQLPLEAPPHKVTPWRPVSPNPSLQLSSNNISLSKTTWTSLGPGPLASGSTNFNVSGRITGIAGSPTDANTIYVATAGGGVWKTTDDGITWTPFTDTQPTLSMGAIAIAPSNHLVLYAGTGEANNSGDSNYGRGILVTTDGGATWTIETGPSGVFNTQRMSTSEIAVDPTNANVAYAAMADFGVNGVYNGTPGSSNGPGIWKTTDGGASWKNLTTSINSQDPWSAVVVDPNAPSTVYAALGRYDGRPSSGTNGVYKSVDGGTTWTLLTGAPNGTTAGRISLAISKSNAPGILYVTTQSSSTFGLLSVVRSDNGGVSFVTVSPPNYMGAQGWYDQWAAVDPTNSAIVYVGGSAGTNSILRSTNSGATWSDISTGAVSPFASPHADHHGVTFDSNGKLLDGDDGGIYRLNNPSAPSWTDLNGNLETIQFEGIGLHPTDVNKVIGGSQDNGTELFTGSTLWTETDGGDSGFAKFSSTNGSRVYHQIPIASFGTNFFRRSDDGGNTWVTKTSNISVDTTQNFYAPFVVDPANGDRVLYGTTRVWETVDGGDSWSVISQVGVNGWNPTGANVDSIGLAPSDVNTIYASAAGRIFLTANHGATWTDRSIPGVITIADIEVDPHNALTAYAVLPYFSTSGNVFRTTNGGTTWTNISSNLPSDPVWSLQIDTTTSPSTLYLGTDNGVYVSTNLGSSWNRFGAGLPDAQVFQIALNENLHVLCAGTHGRGVWEIITPATPPLPTVSSVSPNAGPTGGGNTVTINGTNFLSGASVKFATTASATVTFVSATQLKAVAPAHTAGTVDVTVTTSGGTSLIVAGDHYAYGLPTVISFTPTSGITGSTVTVTGTGLVPGATVKFGTEATTTITFVSGTQIKATVPNGATTGKISLTTAAGTGTSASNFAATLSVTGFSPASGPSGTVVTITGVGFNSSSGVKFNGTAASSVVHVSSTQLKATVPSTATTGPITVTNTTSPAGTVRSAANYTKT